MSKLRVNDILPANGLNIGVGTAGGNFIVGGASTTVVVNGGVNATGSVTATTFIGDGSGITGVTASGSGIEIKDSGSIVGVAATIDFSTNLNVSPASAGIVTVTVGDTDFAIVDKIVHTGDTDTAIRFPAADTISAETGGSERLRITGIGSVGIGTDNIQALLHVHREISSGYEHITSLGHGADTNFKLVTSNGANSNSSGQPVGRLGMHYQGTGWDAYAEWLRGSGAQNGSLKFITSGGSYTPLTLNADGTSTFGSTIIGTSISLTSNITQTAAAPQHFFKETGSTYGNTLWALTRDGDGFSVRWNNAAPYAFISQTSGGSVANVQLKGGQLIIDSNNALDAICVYNTTTSGGANVNVASTGLVRRSTSSAKYKTNVETIEDSYSDALLNCRPVYYRSTCENDNPDYGWWGFIAEEVAEIDPRLVYYKEVDVAFDGEGGKTETPCELEPEGVAYERFVPHLLNLIKRQKQAIETLESRVAALEAE